jgi:hypothetical protein
MKKWSFKRDSIHRKFSMTGQEKGEVFNTSDWFDCNYLLLFLLYNLKLTLWHKNYTISLYSTITFG